MPVPALRVIEISPRQIIYDPLQDRSDVGVVYRHLKHYLSLSEVLPAISVEIKDRCFHATRRLIYLRVANELGRDKIRAVLSGATTETPDLARIRGFIRIVPEAEIRAEADDPEPRGWHVIYFAGRLTEAQKGEINQRFHSFLRGKVPLLKFGDVEPFLEARFSHPQSEEGSRHYIAFLHELSRDVAAIDTVSGHKFE